MPPPCVLAGAPERTHGNDRDTELVGQRQQLALALAFPGVVRDLQHLEPLRPQRIRELAECRCLVVRHAEAPYPAILELTLEPLEVVAPRDEVVHLLHVDAAVPLELARELAPSLVDRRRPDLRGDDRPVSLSGERGRQRLFGTAVHRRRVEQAHAGAHRGGDDFAGEIRVVVERAPRAEADDGPEAALLHHARAPSSSASVTSTIASRSATEMCSFGVWMSVIPFARLTHSRPRSLRTFASAAPPDSSYTTSCPHCARAWAASVTARSPFANR